MEAAVTITLDEPARWAVLMTFDGEMTGSVHGVYPSEREARARRDQLRRSHPRHQVHLVCGTTTWTEEA